jgi:leucyl/phenylalanyl-tRNA--protein transferase
MPVYELDPYYMAFPPADHANPDGLLAIGGKLTEDWLLMAYQNGIFPWFSEGDPIMWWSPNPRFILRPENIKVSKSMRPFLNSEQYSFKLDSDFEQVIEECSSIPRQGQNGTWITTHMKDAYIALHRIGMAHSAEVWEDDQLIGGLYGVSIGRMFFGESMFSKKPNASKLALIKLCKWLSKHGFKIIDCQVYSEHLERMGAEYISREFFMELLREGVGQPSLRGAWKF